MAQAQSDHRHRWQLQQQKEQQQANDALLRQLAARHRSITGLLDTFFGFLKRHTDFFLVNSAGRRSSGGAAVAAAHAGFPPGRAEQLTLVAFKKHALAAVDSVPVPISASSSGEFGIRNSDHRSNSNSSHCTGAGGRAAATTTASAARPPAAAAAALVTQGRRGDARIGEKRLGAASGAAVLERMRANLKLSARTERRCSGAAVPNGGDADGAGGSGRDPGDGTDGRGNTDATNREGGAPLLQTPINNGGVTEQYWWEQTLSSVTICVPVPHGVRAKGLDVQVQKAALSLRLTDTEPPGAPGLHGQLFAPVRHSDAVWALDAEAALVTIELDKTRPAWWHCALCGDARIDTTLVDATQAISEYDAATQAEIRRVMFEQRQKKPSPPPPVP